MNDGLLLSIGVARPRRGHDTIALVARALRVRWQHLEHNQRRHRSVV